MDKIPTHLQDDEDFNAEVKADLDKNNKKPEAPKECAPKKESGFEYKERVKKIKDVMEKGEKLELDEMSKTWREKKLGPQKGRCCFKYGNRRGARIIQILDILSLHPVRGPMALLAYCAPKMFKHYANMRFCTFIVHVILYMVAFIASLACLVLLPEFVV